MSKKNLIDENFLFDAVGEINDRWIEQAADYKKSSKIVSFPFYKYVNVAAALIICIISTIVFVQLKPVNEINNTLIIPTVHPTAITDTEAPDTSTDRPDEVISTETPSPSESVTSTRVPNFNRADRNENELIDNFNNRFNANELILPTANNTNNNSVVNPAVKPTVRPGYSDSYIPTDNPFKTAEPDASKSPTETNKPIATSHPQETGAPTESDSPIITIIPTSVPSLAPTLEPTEIWTSIPTEIPKNTETVTPTFTPTGSWSPTESPKPSPRPTKTPGIEWTMIPTETPKPTFTPRPTGPFVPGAVPPVYGKEAIIENLNGAVYDEENRIIEFTSESAKSRNGVEIINPIAGNASMVEDYGYLYDKQKEGYINVFRLTGSKLGWGRDEVKLQIPEDGKIFYPTPENKAGFSISFWAKSAKESDSSAAIVFANDDQTIAVSLSGTVKYIDGENILNKFYAYERSFLDTKWHYYTITFANDWIGFYMDGLRVAYDHVELRLSEIGQFNDGFLTRENSFNVHENQRYEGVNSVERLLLTFMSDENTSVYLGGGEVSVANASSKYSFETGTKMCKVEYYLKELTLEEVYANYNVARMQSPE